MKAVWLCQRIPLESNIGIRVVNSVAANRFRFPAATSLAKMFNGLTSASHQAPVLLSRPSS
jgi:hypothetical protein